MLTHLDSDFNWPILPPGSRNPCQELQSATQAEGESRERESRERWEEDKEKEED